MRVYNVKPHKDATMQVEIDIPTNVERALRDEWGDLARAAKEALAIESYRTGRISLGLLAEMLNMGTIEADAWLAERGVPLPYTLQDLDADRRDLADLFPELRR
jgi:predicted HTH domain antitoxin